jgi:hypothetical protein
MLTHVYLVWYTPYGETHDALWGVYANRKNAERIHDFIIVNKYGNNVRIQAEEIMDAE